MSGDLFGDPLAELRHHHAAAARLEAQLARTRDLATLDLKARPAGMTAARWKTLHKRVAELRRQRAEDIAALKAAGAEGDPVEVMAHAMRRSAAWPAVHRAGSARLLAEAAYAALLAMSEPTRGLVPAMLDATHDRLTPS